MTSTENLTDSIPTSPGTGFDQRGHVVQGDQINIAGNVQGDVILKRLDPDDIRNQRNHAALRYMVRSFWIDGVLKHSLYNEVLIRLNLEQRPEAVDNRPWDLILQRPDLADESLPPGTSIVEIFDHMGQRLLILGEPGSGKTTMLLELADALLKRAETDPFHPTPVVFNLSSWAVQSKPLADWLVTELREKYNIPPKLAQVWLENSEIILLLDGLDEVKPTHRRACVAAINTFRQNHLVPLAVCCRTNEYQVLGERLAMYGAVQVRPLSATQITQYLERANLAIYKLEDSSGQISNELLPSPLMLNIVALTLAGQDPNQHIALSDDGYSRQDLFNLYLRRMFHHRALAKVYSPAQTLSWLSWLAQHMTTTSIASFAIDDLQPSWLKQSWQRKAFKLLVWLLVGIPIGSLIGWGIGYPIFQVGLPTIGMVAGVVVFATVFIACGLLATKTFSIGATAFVGASIGFSLALPFGLHVGAYVGALFNVIYAIVGSVLYWLAGRRMATSSSQIEPIERLVFDSKRLLIGGAAGALAGFVFGAFFGIANQFALRGTTSPGDVDMLPNLVFGIAFSVAGAVTAALLYGFTHKTTIDPQTPNQRIYSSVRNATLIGSLTGVTTGILLGFVGNYMWVLYLPGYTGSSVGLHIGVAIGLGIGLAVSLFFGGLASIQHFVLRTMIYLAGYGPWNYTSFLNHCVSRIFLRRVGGGYIFIHRLLLEHIAALTAEDIKQITQASD